MPYVTTCAHCGKQFSKYPSQTTRRFCSRECYNAAHVAPMTTATCKVCGKVFAIKQSYDGRYTYCGDDCRKSLNQPRVCGVYMIECLVNGMVYIGSSVHINRRWRGHRSKLNSGTHENPHLQQDYNLFGSDGFSFAILGITAKPNLTRLEQIFLDGAMARGICYNVFPNTETALGRTFSPEQRKEISRRNKGRVITDEHRRKLSVALKRYKARIKSTP